MDKKPIQPTPERNKDALARQSLTFAAMRDRLTQYMESKAMRKTPERYEVLRVANMSGSIFTIDELMTQMQQHGEFQVSRATLFNTMELLCEAGLAIKHPLATAAHFEMQTDSLPKAYVICFAESARALFQHRTEAGLYAWPLQEVSSQEPTGSKKKQERKEEKLTEH